MMAIGPPPPLQQYNPSNIRSESAGAGWRRASNDGCLFFHSG